MAKKPKFNPEITRIKLNPEQAVLACSCYNTGNQAGANISSQRFQCRISPSKSTVYTFGWTTGTTTT